MASILPLALINAEHSARAGAGEEWNVIKKLMCVCSERQMEGNGWESKNLKQCSSLQGEQAKNDVCAEHASNRLCLQNGGYTCSH